MPNLITTLLHFLCILITLIQNVYVFPEYVMSFGALMLGIILLLQCEMLVIPLFSHVCRLQSSSTPTKQPPPKI